MKTKRSNLYLIVLFLSIIAIIACKKDVNSNNGLPYNPLEVGYYPNGFGIYPGNPVCTPLVLPLNVIILGEIRGSWKKSSSFDKLTQTQNPKDTYVQVGTGGLSFYIKFFNKNSYQQEVVIPGGLILCCHDTSSQNGTTTQNDTIIIPPHDSLTCILNAYCTNKQRTFKPVIYDILGTTLHQSLFELIQILKPKQKLNFAQVTFIQNIIWNITNGSGMTDDDRAFLNSLP
ncbi:MAG: hypothetical protein NTZ33_15860 [Bacteroidetes bacterium]|nr:hypothetical protein [Bacteroidota bacterium]